MIVCVSAMRASRDCIPYRHVPNVRTDIWPFTNPLHDASNGGRSRCEISGILAERANTEVSKSVGESDFGTEIKYFKNLKV